MRNTYPLHERLKSPKLISLLFEQGNSSYSYPLNFVYRTYSSENDDERPVVRATVSVSKRKFRKATDRNRIKRQLRELYRLHKKEIHHLVPAGKVMDCMFIYTSREKEPYAVMEAALLKILNRMLSRGNNE